MLFLDLVLLALAALCALPSGVFFAECAASLFSRNERMATSERMAKREQGAQPSQGTSVSLVVLVPAHDEETVLGATLAGLQNELRPRDRLLVIADNCSDRTAHIAREHQAEVLERKDDARRGKGYALSHGFDHLRSNPPDVVVVVDADCRVSPGALHHIAQRSLDTGRPVQAEYLLLPPPRPTPKSAVSALAVLVRNRVRPRGLRALGLPTHLTGSGMAFPFELFLQAPPTESDLVEDLRLGIEFARLGKPPLLSTAAHVLSELPERDAAALGQRRRWEHGQLGTMLRQGPRLVFEGVRRAKLGLVALGLDLMVPPLSLLVLALLVATAATCSGILLGAMPLPAAVCVASLSAVGGGTVLGWLRHGRAVVGARALLSVPGYVLWKIPLYVAFLVRRKQKAWERTERAGE